MDINLKLHKKLNKPKQATVSLDSLLGLLSSAYGTEQIDSTVVFKENKINWQNLSVENFKAAPKKQATEGEKEKKFKSKETIQQNNVATSTTSLKPSKSESEVDITLVSIKSLKSLNLLGDKFEQDKSETGKKSGEEGKDNIENVIDTQDITALKASEQDQTLSEMDDQKATGDCLEIQISGDDQRKVICGFYVDDANYKVVFDIQFMKKIEPQEVTSLFGVEEPEISLNVVDVLKQTKLSIKVDKASLISKVKYFADIDKELGLENLDIAIKCNLNVFNWIVQWIKADISMCKPNLNDTNLRPVLLIAHHLKIDLLVKECLCYFHENCKNVLETDWDIVDVLDDDLVLQLVSKFTSAEIDSINDFFDIFKAKLYCSLIRLLNESKPSTEVGHYFTLSTLFQCGFCEKLFHFNMADSIPCSSDCTQLNFRGEMVPLHQQLPSWNFSRYVELMYEQLGSWKAVYWRLWGKCHFLKCGKCNFEFPLEQHDWCSYHPEDVEFFSINSHEFYPIGTYKCCGKVAFRFNVLKPYGGCKFKSHSPELGSESEKKIYKVFQCYKHMICCQPPESLAPKKFVKLVKKSENVLVENDINSEHFWWNGVRLAPKEKEDQSVIPKVILNKVRNKPEEKKSEPKFNPIIFKPPVPMGIMSLNKSLSKLFCHNDIEQSTAGLSSTKNKKSKHKGAVKKGRTSSLGSPGRVRHKKKKLTYLYQPLDSFWVASDTNKDNQDNQRDFEEIAMRNLIKILTPEDASASNLEPTAGTYIRLEAEWWQEYGGDSKMAGTSKSSGTVVNRTYPLSWFRKLSL